MFSGFTLATGFATNYPSFLVIRAMFGIAMGGEWGLGTSLAIESIPKECRGIMGGILQQGITNETVKI